MTNGMSSADTVTVNSDSPNNRSDQRSLVARSKKLAVESKSFSTCGLHERDRPPHDREHEGMQQQRDAELRGLDAEPCLCGDLCPDELRIDDTQMLPECVEAKIDGDRDCGDVEDPEQKVGGQICRRVA